MPALRRRGYQAGALRKFAESMGVSLADKVVSQEDLFKTLNAFNRELSMLVLVECSSFLTCEALGRERSS